MLDTGVPVGHHVEIHVVEGTPFGDDHHAFASRCLGELLALLAPRLNIAFDADGALHFQASDVSAGIIQRIDSGPAIAFGPIHDFCGRIGAWREYAPGASVFGRSEHAYRLTGRVVHRGHAERQMSQRGPVLLRHDEILGVRSMRVGVDQARHDSLAVKIDHYGILRNADIVTHGL